MGRLPPAAQTWNVSEGCGSPGRAWHKQVFNSMNLWLQSMQTRVYYAWSLKKDASCIKLSCRNSIQVMFNDSFYPKSRTFLLGDSACLMVVFYPLLKMGMRVEIWGLRMLCPQPGKRGFGSQVCPLPLSALGLPAFQIPFILFKMGFIT